MSVVTSRHDLVYPAGPTCTFCGDKQYHPPFIQWMGDRELVICGKCCSGLDGLVADIIQLTAIMELQRLYPRATLIRKDQS